MSFATEIAKSVSDARILVDLDIGELNVQWVNNGAGLWAVDALNVYSWVDSTLLVEGFSAQNFGVISSVNVDGITLTQVDTLAEVTTTDQSFFYDTEDRMVTVRLVDFDEPSIHTIWLGIIYGYSFDEFTPVGANWRYEGRLISSPSISIRRDPLFFGKLIYGGGSPTINNMDGALDSFVENSDIYGNAARVWIGFPSLNISDYQRLYTGRIGGISVGESDVTPEIVDNRKQLAKPITLVAANTNALDLILSILENNFSAVYNDTYFDTTAWNAAQALVENVTVNMQEPAPAIEVIEKICESVFGLFLITADGKYTFKIVDTTAAAGSTINAIDIMNAKTVNYEPTEVLSSVRVGYARDWLTSGTQYTYYRDTSAEASVFTQYKTYNEQTFDTYLIDLTAATAFGTTIMNRFRAVHGQVSVEVPMSYYATEIADIVDAEILRPNKTMIGTTKSEIVSIDYNLNGPTMTLGLRFV